MKRTGQLIIAAAIMLNFSCHRAGQQVAEVKDKGITVQISPLKDNDVDNLNYKARLVLDKRTAENITPDLKNKFYYQMDSCFYMVDKTGIKRYARLVQSVANGVKDSYEYLLEFDPDQADKSDSVNIVYEDRYIDHKQYPLKLAKK